MKQQVRHTGSQIIELQHYANVVYTNPEVPFGSDYSVPNLVFITLPAMRAYELPEMGYVENGKTYACINVIFYNMATTVGTVDRISLNIDFNNTTYQHMDINVLNGQDVVSKQFYMQLAEEITLYNMTARIYDKSGNLFMYNSTVYEMELKNVSFKGMLDYDYLIEAKGLYIAQPLVTTQDVNGYGYITPYKATSKMLRLRWLDLKKIASPADWPANVMFNDMYGRAVHFDFRQRKAITEYSVYAYVSEDRKKPFINCPGYKPMEVSSEYMVDNNKDGVYTTTIQYNKPLVGDCLVIGDLVFIYATDIGDTRRFDSITDLTAQLIDKGYSATISNFRIILGASDPILRASRFYVIHIDDTSTNGYWKKIAETVNNFMDVYIEDSGYIGLWVGFKTNPRLLTQYGVFIDE